MSFLSSQNLEVIRWVTLLLSPIKNMQFCNEQIRTQPLFSPPCGSATYGSTRMCRRKNSNKLKQTEQDILNPSAEVLVIWLFYYSPAPKHRSINWVSMDSGNGFPPVWRQAITWSSADLIKSPRYTGGYFMFCTGSYSVAGCGAATAGHRFLFTR